MQAVGHFLRCSSIDDGSAIDMAIKTVGEARDKALTKRLIDYLMGDEDGDPKVRICVLIEPSSDFFLFQTTVDCSNLQLDPLPLNLTK